MHVSPQLSSAPLALRQMMRHWVALLAALAFCLSLSASLHAQNYYQVVQVSQTGSFQGVVHAISDNGKALLSTLESGVRKNRVYDAATAGLTTYFSGNGQGIQPQSNDVNNAGYVTLLPYGTPSRPHYWHDGTDSEIPAPAGFTFYWVYAINNQGWMLLKGRHQDASVDELMIWKSPTVVERTGVWNFSFVPHGAFNDSGHFVYNIASGVAKIYQAGQITDLGSLGGTTVVPIAINNQDQVVGMSNTVGNTSAGRRAFIWQGGSMTEVGPAPAAIAPYGTSAFAINNHGDILFGQADVYQGDYLFRGGQVVPIHTLAAPGSLGPAGAELTSADFTCIDDNGRIGGKVNFAFPVNQQAVILNPPPPSFLVTPSSLTFTTTTSQDLMVNSTDSRSLTFQIDVATTTGGNWLSASTSGFTLPAGGQGVVAVTPDFSGLTLGQTYQGTITITSGSSTQTIGVTAAPPAPLDTVTVLSEGLAPADGSSVLVGRNTPFIFMPVSYKLGSRASATLAVIARDQGGNVLGSTDEVVIKQGTGLQNFVLRGFKDIPELVSALELRAVIVGDSSLLAASPAIHYLVPSPTELPVTWGQYDRDDTIFPLMENSEDKFIPTDPASLFIAVNWKLPKLEFYTPAASVTLAAAPLDRQLFMHLAYSLNGEDTEISTVDTIDIPAGHSGTHILRANLPESCVIPPCDTAQLFVRLVDAQSRTVLAQATRTIAVESISIERSLPPPGGRIIAPPTVDLRCRIPAGQSRSLSSGHIDSGGELVFDREIVASVGGGSTLLSGLVLQEGDLHPTGNGLTKRFIAVLKNNAVSSSAVSMNYEDRRDAVVLIVGSGNSAIDGGLTLFFNPSLAQTRQVTAESRRQTVALKADGQGSGDVMVPPPAESFATVSSASDSGFLSINRTWNFDPPIPDDGTFAATLTIDYDPADFPSEPGFAEEALKIVAIDPATGQYTVLPTTIDLVNRKATAHITSLAALYTLGVFGPFASHTVDLPLWVSGQQMEGSVVLANRSGSSTNVSLAAWDSAGFPLLLAGTTPVSLPLGARQSQSQTVQGLFGFDPFEASGWIQPTLQANAFALLRLESAGKLEFAAPPVRAVTQTIANVSHSSTGFSTELHLVNPGIFENETNLEARHADGSLVAVGTFILPPHARVAGLAEALIPALPSGFVGSVRISSSQLLSALAVRSGGRAASVIPSVPNNGSRNIATTLCAPWFASGGGTHRAILNLVNHTPTSATVSISALDDDGNPMTPAVNRTLAAGAQLSTTLKDLLTLNDATRLTGSVLVTCDRTGIGGHVLVEENAANPTFASVFPLSDQARSNIVFAALDNSPDRSTQFSVFNPSSSTAQVLVSVFNASGTSVGTTRFALPAGTRITQNLATLLPATAGLASGFFTIGSSAPMFASASVQDATGNFFTSVPGQTSQPVPPLSVAAPTSVVARVGTNVEFNALPAGGTPSFQFRWRLNGSDLTDGGRYAGTTTSNLTLSSVVLADSGGVYDVVVTDSAGSIVLSSSATLTVGDTSPLGVTQPPSFVSAARVILAGQVNPFGIAANVVFEWGTSATALTKVAAAAPSTVSGTGLVSVSAELTGLTGNTTYYYRVRGTNGVGTGAGAVLSFKTAVAVPPLVTTLAASAITHNGATLNGTLNPRNAATAASFQHGLTTAYGATAPATPGMITGNVAVPVNATLTGLTPHTKYNFRLNGSSDNGAANGTNLTFTTANRSPVATADPVIALPSAKVVIHVLANDSDPDGDPLSIYSFTQPGAAVGTVAKVGADLVFTPSATFSGGSFTYIASDAFAGKSPAATVTLSLASCTVNATATIPADSPPYDLTVTATAPWTVIESIPWLSFVPPGPGDTKVRFIPSPNPGIASRTGTLKIGGQTHQVTQEGLPGAPLLTTPSPIPNAAISASYDLAIPTQNGPVTYTATGLPKGMTLSNITGHITGMPTEAKTSNITVTAKNALGVSNLISFSITVLPFPPSLVGNYSATIADSQPVTDQLGGLMTMSVTNVGVVTGALKLGTGSHSFNGRLNTAVDPLAPDPDHAVLEVNVARSGKTAVALTVHMNSGSANLITGDVTLIGSPPASLTGSKHVWNAVSNAASSFQGSYTVALQPTSASALIPQGDGFLTFTVSPAGGVTWSGQLADGTVIAPRSASLWAEGSVPLFVLLYSSKGSLNQRLSIAPTTRIVSGTPRWFKKPQAASVRAYAAGFGPTDLQADGGVYVAPLAGATLLNIPAPGTASIAFSLAGINSVGQFNDLDQVFGVSAAHVTTFSTSTTVNPAQVKIIKLDITKGTFSGTFTLKDTNPFNATLPQISRPVSFSGILLPAASTGTGYFLLPGILGPPANVTTSPLASGLVHIVP